MLPASTTLPGSVAANPLSGLAAKMLTRPPPSPTVAVATPVPPTVTLPPAVSDKLLPSALTAPLTKRSPLATAMVTTPLPTTGPAISRPTTLRTATPNPFTVPNTATWLSPPNVILPPAPGAPVARALASSRAAKMREPDNSCMPVSSASNDNVPPARISPVSCRSPPTPAVPNDASLNAARLKFAATVDGPSTLISLLVKKPAPVLVRLAPPPLCTVRVVPWITPAVCRMPPVPAPSAIGEDPPSKLLNNEPPRAIPPAPAALIVPLAKSNAAASVIPPPLTAPPLLPFTMMLPDARITTASIELFEVTGPPIVRSPASTSIATEFEPRTGPLISSDGALVNVNARSALSRSIRPT